MIRNIERRLMALERAAVGNPSSIDLSFLDEGERAELERILRTHKPAGENIINVQGMTDDDLEFLMSLVEKRKQRIGAH